MILFGLIMMSVGIIGLIFIYCKWLVGFVIRGSIHYIPKTFRMIGFFIFEILRLFMIVKGEFDGSNKEVRREKRERQEEIRNSKQRQYDKEDERIHRAANNRAEQLKQQFPSAPQGDFEFYIENFNYFTPKQLKEMEEIIQENHLKNTAI